MDDYGARSSDPKLDPAFDAALDRHVAALASRNLPVLGSTIANDIAFVESNGARSMGREGYLNAYRDLFAAARGRLVWLRRDSRSTRQTGWALIEYGSHKHDEAFLGLTFALINGQWLVIAGQNTPLPPVEENY